MITHTSQDVLQGSEEQCIVNLQQEEGLAIDMMLSIRALSSEVAAKTHEE